MICKYCGKALEEGSLFCNGCGQSTTGVANATQPVQQYGVQQYYPPNYQYVNRGAQSNNNDMLYIIIGLLVLIGIGVFMFAGDYCDIPMPWDELF